MLRFISLCATFNPRPPWGGRLIIKILQVIVNYFNPRPPWGGRRHSSLGCRYSHGISIHALRGEGDDAQPGDAVKRNDFNPRPPWGGRRKQRERANIFCAISIHALRGEGDFSLLEFVPLYDISIHALRGEGDALRALCFTLTAAFQSTPSVGRATRSARRRRQKKRFQSTPSVGRATKRLVAVYYTYIDFNPRPPWGGRHSNNRYKNR